MSDEPVKIAQEPPKDVKSFTFSTDELTVLNSRKSIIDLYSLIINDLNLIVQQYILTTVVPRCGINPDEYDISFNLKDGKLNCTKKPPQIIKPTDGIILPK